MLEIKNIVKVYNTEGFKQTALNKVSINFRKNEFVSILGPSGSGKTTLLNIIGGLDHYTSGDLIINGTSTKKYKDSDWDSYRNHRVGFVFQNYNLISHQSILSNVTLALTLSGISKKDAINKAKKALNDVGLSTHINKRPNQLSGGQMQRVAIARALVNDPDILLADEPTGALDSQTSIQIMELLKKISKDKLVIMVTHNPELATKYSSRIINLKDGEIVSDSDKFDISKNAINESFKEKKTKMSLLTAFFLSFNNLMTKKARTILVSIAGSIGIIGIALILALSTGFQNYIDKIQEDTLSSYPLTIMNESTDITGALLSMTGGGSSNDKKNGKVVEQQYISSILSSVSTNDLKSFKKFLDDNSNKVSNITSSIKYSYSIDPMIYTIDSTNKLSKVNPSNLFSSIYSDSIMSSYSSYTSIYSQMNDDFDLLNESYEVLAGRWPSKYDEMIIVLNDSSSISDLLVYSLGLRDTNELTEMVSTIMSGGTVNNTNEPLELSYDDLMNIDLRLILPTDLYKYNSNYNVYEDMSENSSYINNLFESSLKLKIVGVVSSKSGTTSMALNSGVNYTYGLVDYIINKSKSSDIVNKQLTDLDIDVFSGKRFDSVSNNLDVDFSSFISVDSNKLNSAFNININQDDIANKTKNYMSDISDSITTDISFAYDDFYNNLTFFVNNMFDNISDNISLNDVNSYVDGLFNGYEFSNKINSLPLKYYIPSDSFTESYSGLLKSLLNIYISTYYSIDNTLTTDINNPVATLNTSIKDSVISSFLSSSMVTGVCDTFAHTMTEVVMKKDIMIKVSELMGDLTNTYASSFNIDSSKIASAFNFNLTEDELTRIVSAMMNNKESSASSNLISLGYQDVDDPTYISFYFNSFDQKEEFLSFIDKYNIKNKNTSKEIKYTDTTGLLMGSVKTIVNAVSYVLIAFVSISLIVSSIMIGIITYISVYERTKEIGILRAIGASKRNISSIFNAETFIIGLLSGLFGIIITYVFIPIINLIIHKLVGNIPLSATLNIFDAVLLVLLSIILTIIGGFIPSKKASKKDPVEALRCD